MTGIDSERFYRGAAVGLGMLEARAGTARRFGSNADARWNAFRGGLQDWDRVELLVRDAAVHFPAGFSPRMVFDLPALAEDEPCGPDWPGPGPTQAKDLLHQASKSPPDLGPGLEMIASIWGLKPRRPPESSLTDIQPSTRFLLCGAGAVMAVSFLFNGRPELDLADQAVLVADDPGTRQLFGLALAWLERGNRRPAHLVRSGATPELLKRIGFGSLDRSIVSEDVEDAIREKTLMLAQSMGVRR